MAPSDQLTGNSKSEKNCPLCLKSFTMDTMKEHISVEHLGLELNKKQTDFQKRIAVSEPSLEIIDKRRVENFASEKKRFVCDSCEESFDTLHLWQVHNIQNHKLCDW